MQGAVSVARHSPVPAAGCRILKNRNGLSHPRKKVPLFLCLVDTE